MARARSSSNNSSTANLRFESRERGISLAADKLRSNMDAAFFNDSDTAPRGSALSQTRDNL